MKREEAMQRLIDALQSAPDGTITDADAAASAAGLTSQEFHSAKRAARRLPSGLDGQFAVRTRPGLPADYLWTTDDVPILRDQLRHLKNAYRRFLNVYWSEHMRHERKRHEGAPYEETARIFHELQNMQGLLAQAEGHIIDVSRELDYSDRSIVAYFRSTESFHDVAEAYGLAS